MCALGLHDFRWPPHWQMPPGSTLYFGLTFAAECARPGCNGRAVLFCRPDSHFAEHHPDDLPGTAEGTQGQ